MGKLLPTDPEIIKDYLAVLKAVERESQIYDPLPVRLLLDAVQIERNRASAILKKIIENEAGLKLFTEQQNVRDSLKLDPYGWLENIDYVKIFNKALLKQLINRLKHQLDKSESHLMTTDSRPDKIDWPDVFRWKDENTYDLDGKRKISFMSKEDNKTKTYFKMMADAKTWVKVSDMSKATGEKANQIRSKLNQIKEKIRNKNASHLLAVEPRKDHSAGAYRLVPHPNRND